VLAAGTVVTPGAFLEPGWLRVSAGRIADLGSGNPPRKPDVDAPTGMIVPGFVDTHVHGGGGGSFSTTEPEEAVTAARFHLAHGTTSLVASLVSAPTAELARQADALADLAQDGVLAGIHLEGPWLSPRFKGAHDESFLRSPDPGSVSALMSAGRGFVRMVTLAPELDPDLRTVRTITDSGAVVAVGHTAADYDTTRAAIDAGATVATHLFNAMPALHHREPGPALALLEDPRVTVELIVDGVHLHPRVAQWAMRCSVGGVALVTDAISAAGQPDGSYRLGGSEVEVRDGTATLAGSGTIAGSTLTMHQALVRSVHGGLSLDEAVRACSAGPAEALGLGDVGALERGRLADLVLLDHDLTLRRVMHRGEWTTCAADQP
jgi:N-acetylglucosamine-6-phosphate deacetylase